MEKSDEGANALEFWLERVAMMAQDSNMKVYEAEHYATTQTVRWCRRTGENRPEDGRWMLLARDVTGDEAQEPGEETPNPKIVPNKGWWK